MAQLIIELPDELNEQIKQSTLTEDKLNELVTRFINLWLQQETRLPTVESTNHAKCSPRKAGSGKHLQIKIADDFDEPLEDFAEYMW